MAEAGRGRWRELETGSVPGTFMPQHFGLCSVKRVVRKASLRTLAPRFKNMAGRKSWTRRGRVGAGNTLPPSAPFLLSWFILLQIIYYHQTFSIFFFVLFVFPLSKIYTYKGKRFLFVPCHVPSPGVWCVVGIKMFVD